jgi:hypothetical protein
MLVEVSKTKTIDLPLAIPEAVTSEEKLPILEQLFGAEKPISAIKLLEDPGAVMPLAILKPAVDIKCS